MISQKSLTTEWLDQVSRANRNADKILVEKVIRALMLLEGLAASKLKFTFKGGTALMLLLGSTKRLSIDIDIIVSNKDELEPIFDTFITQKGFNRYELQERHNVSTIEKAHYKFYYNPVHKQGMAEDYVLLDILFEQPHYIKIVDQPISSSFVIHEGEAITVPIPGFEDLLGDKLTAFAPYTTGIPYEKGGVLRSMEIIKQLYDIGSLVPHATDTGIVSKTFQAFAKTELGYRKFDPDIAPVLEDIYLTALHICTRGEDGKGEIDHLMRGMAQVRQFIFSESYHLERAITDASKAAYVAKVIKHGSRYFEKFENAAQIKDMLIEQPVNIKLTKLKKTNPEAFFYWCQIYLLEKSSKQEL